MQLLGEADQDLTLIMADVDRQIQKLDGVMLNEVFESQKVIGVGSAGANLFFHLGTDLSGGVDAACVLTA